MTRLDFDKIYGWRLNHLPHRIMYVRRMIDDQHSMWMPRWGLSDKKMQDATKWADDMVKNINWDDEEKKGGNTEITGGKQKV